MLSGGWVGARTAAEAGRVGRLPAAGSTATLAERPWLAIYPERLPADFEPSVRNGVELFARGSLLRPDAPAVHYFDASLSHRELDELARSLAAAFASLGVRRGDRVALYLQNVPQFVAALHAAWLLGAIVVPINPMLKERELAFQLADCRPSLLVCLESLHEIAANVFDGIVLTTSELELLLSARPPALLEGRRPSTAPGAADLLDLARRRRGERFEEADPEPDDIALLVYTSGTTGPPKAATNTHRNVCFNAEVFQRWMDLGDDDVVLGIAPLFHVTGLIAHIACARLATIPLVLSYRFDAAELLRLIERHRGTFAIGALTAFIALLDHPDRPQRDISSLTKVFTGGAPVAPAVVERFERATGVYVHNTYGLTEATSPTHLTPIGLRAPIDPATGALSVGVPVSGVDCRVVDTETGAELPAGEIGEIATRGPMVVPGYWERPEETAHAIRDGWLFTGDVGKRDERGWFYLVDRAKDLIVASGYKVWPREVEDVLYEHPAVQEACVVGVPDEYRGETVKAFVTLKPGAEATSVELIEHCKPLLAAYKYPRLVEIVDELPKTATGKVLRRELRSHPPDPEKGAR